MANFMYASDYIRPLIRNIRFVLIVFGRCLYGLLTGTVRLRHTTLHYETDNLFDSSLLVIHYQCRNALWYSFKGIKRTNVPGVIVLNLERVPDMPLVFTVHGIFQKQSLLIDVSPEAQLHDQPFHTSLTGLRAVNIPQSVIGLRPISMLPHAPPVQFYTHQVYKPSVPIYIQHSTVIQITPYERKKFLHNP